MNGLEIGLLPESNASPPLSLPSQDKTISTFSISTSLLATILKKFASLIRYELFKSASPSAQADVLPHLIVASPAYASLVTTTALIPQIGKEFA